MTTSLSKNTDPFPTRSVLERTGCTRPKTPRALQSTNDAAALTASIDTPCDALTERGVSSSPQGLPGLISSPCWGRAFSFLRPWIGDVLGCAALFLGLYACLWIGAALS